MTEAEELELLTLKRKRGSGNLGPDWWDRFITKGFAKDPKSGANYLGKKFPDIEFKVSKDGDILYKPHNQVEKGFYQLDPSLDQLPSFAEKAQEVFKDVAVDLPVDIAQGLAQGAATAGGALAGGAVPFLGPVGAMAGGLSASTASGAALRALKAKIANFIDPELNKDGPTSNDTFDTTSMLIDAVSPVLFGTGAANKVERVARQKIKDISKNSSGNLIKDFINKEDLLAEATSAARKNQGLLSHGWDFASRDVVPSAIEALFGTSRAGINADLRGNLKDLDSQDATRAATNRIRKIIQEPLQDKVRTINDDIVDVLTKGAAKGDMVSYGDAEDILLNELNRYKNLSRNSSSKPGAIRGAANDIEGLHEYLIGKKLEPTVKNSWEKVGETPRYQATGEITPPAIQSRGVERRMGAQQVSDEAQGIATGELSIEGGQRVGQRRLGSDTILQGMDADPNIPIIYNELVSSGRVAPYSRASGVPEEIYARRVVGEWQASPEGIASQAKEAKTFATEQVGSIPENIRRTTVTKPVREWSPLLAREMKIAASDLASPETASGVASAAQENTNLVTKRNIALASRFAKDQRDKINTLYPEIVDKNIQYGKGMEIINQSGEFIGDTAKTYQRTVEMDPGARKNLIQQLEELIGKKSSKEYETLSDGLQGSDIFNKKTSSPVLATSMSQPKGVGTFAGRRLGGPLGHLGMETVGDDLGSFLSEVYTGGIKGVEYLPNQFSNAGGAINPYEVLMNKLAREKAKQETQ